MGFLLQECYANYVMSRALTCSISVGRRSQANHTVDDSEILHTLDVDNLVDNEIFTISTSLGFLPSTVSLFLPCCLPLWKDSGMITSH